MEAAQENGPAQSPPSRLGLAVNPFLGWLAGSRSACCGGDGKKKKKKRGEVADSGGAWPLSLAASGHPDKTLGQT